MRLLLLLLLLPTLVLAQGGQNKLLTNDNGNVIVGTTTATGETRIIRNGVIVLTTAAGGLGLGLPVLNADGTAALPGMSFLLDLDTGFYRIAGNRLGVSTGATARYEFTDTGAIRQYTSGAALILRSPDGSYSVCTVNNSDVFSCTPE